VPPPHRGLAGASKEWLRFLAANAVGGLVNVGLYSVLVRFAPPPLNDLTVALVLGVLLGLVFNFTLSKKLVFKGRCESSPSGRRAHWRSGGYRTGATASCDARP
jgi:putative flippase GtrA